jgi:hydrogenase maturation protease
VNTDEFWDKMQRRGPATVTVGGVRVGGGSRVRLRPKSRTDIFDLALDGRVAVVERVEQDDDGALYLAVTLEDDPGRDLGEALLPGHRFFFAADDVEPLITERAVAADVRILVAGIGNIFLGDDGFGVEVARRLARRALPPGVDVVDFGIRGMDLVYALQRPYRAAVFIDAAPRGERPGTLTVLEPDLPNEGGVAVQTHGIDPVAALGLARQLGRVPPRTRVVCCEPETVLTGDMDEDLVMALSRPVQSAVEEAVPLVESVVADLVADITATLEETIGGGTA